MVVLGTLVVVVVVVGGRHLRDASMFGKSSPFARISLGLQESQTRTAIRGGQFPSWDHEARFSIESVGPTFPLPPNRESSTSGLSSMRENAVKARPRSMRLHLEM